MLNIGSICVSIFMVNSLFAFGNAENPENSSVDHFGVITDRIAQLEHLMFPFSDNQLDSLSKHLANIYFPVNAPSQPCSNHSKILLDKFLQKEKWALSMWDASSKLASGVLDGHLIDLGNYHQCIKIVHPNHLFMGKHCVIHTAGILPHSDELEEDDWYSLLSSQDVTFSLCVPSSCSAEDVAQHVDLVLARVNASTRYSVDKANGGSESLLNYRLSCSTAESMDFRLKDYLAMAAFSLLAAVVIASTFYENLHGSNSLFSVFSLKSNFRVLMDTKQSPTEISCLNGLRVLCCLQVILYHRMSYSFFFSPIIFQATIFEQFSNLTMGIADLSCRSIDLFLFMSGVVLAYSYFNNKDKGKEFNVPRFYYCRYFRLTPVLGSLVLFAATLAVHIGEGPIWTSLNIFYVEEPCTKHWWTALLHISTIVNPYDMCAGHSWYVVMDFQLHVLAPIFLILLERRRRVGIVLMMVCCAALVSYGAIHAYLNNLHSGAWYSELVRGRPTELTDVAFYYNPYFRASSFLMGIALGLYLSEARNKKDTIKLSKEMLWCGWFTCATTFITLVALSTKLCDPAHEWSPWLDPLFISLSKPLLTATVAWLVFASFHGHGGPISQFLSWSAFRPLARLTYSVYLIHVIMIGKHMASSTTPMEFNYLNYWYLVCGDVFFSFVCGAMLHLFIEIPIFKLALRLYPERRKSEHSTDTIKVTELKSTKQEP